ncbi:fatty-acyl coenzyme A oxidase [Allomyces javanicus]|nr:fatty-acyl coenzyme A oxidase [Allomyces javanicus]
MTNTTTTTMIAAPNREMAALAEERAAPAFPIRDMTYFLDGGKDTTELKEKFMLELERDPVWRKDDWPNLTLPEMRERTMAKARLIVNFLANEPVHVFRARMAVISTIDPGFWTRLGVHYGLFFGALQSQATSNQLTYWVQKGALAVHNMYGCFLMTELGHGSNVQGLETTATFDEASDEFVIHTPSLSATKWWIGGAAHTATHGTVYAQLVVRGKRHGVKVFVVPLRDPKTGTLLPGIAIGDCGKKFGRDGIDNGWVQFTNVRIPRSYMLMKHTQVKRDGTVIDPPLAQLSYGALIQGRVAMVVDSGNTAKKALTIAIRYGAIRRQFASPGADQETKLLDYTIHQHRLLPLLAQTFAMHFAGREVDAMYTALMEQLDSVQPGQDMTTVLETLKETHATSAGLKAYCTWTTLNLIEQCRQTLGGHGYSEYTGLAPMLKDWAVQCTWEGDNTVLTLQLGRFLVGCCREAIAAKTKGTRAKLGAGVAYLAQVPEILKRVCPVPVDEASGEVKDAMAVLDPSILRTAFEVAAACAVAKATREFEAALSKHMQGVSETNKKARAAATERAHEDSAHARFVAAKTHSMGYLFGKFVDGVAKAPADLAAPLHRLVQLYGAHAITEHAGVFLTSGYLTAAHVSAVQTAMNALLRDVRKDAVPLVDAFNLTDFVVGSPFGAKDGNIYERYFERVTKLNPPLPKAPYFESTIKPLLERGIQDEEYPELED